MNSIQSTSQSKENRGMGTQLTKTRKFGLILGFIILSCLTLTPAWAGGHSLDKAPTGNIHLTGLSIQIGPGGFHFGIGVPSYGRGYGGRHFYRGNGPQRHWKHYRHNGHRHHYASPKRFGHRHGWKNDRHRGDFRGKGGRGSGRGNGGHRGGRR